MIPPKPTTRHGRRWRARGGGASSSELRASADSRVMPTRRRRSSTCSRRRMSIDVVDPTTPIKCLPRYPRAWRPGRGAMRSRPSFQVGVGRNPRLLRMYHATQEGVVGRDEQLGRRPRAQKTPAVADHAHQFPIGADLPAHRLCRVAGISPTRDVSARSAEASRVGDCAVVMFSRFAIPGTTATRDALARAPPDPSGGMSKHCLQR
jgi:hypothetical protein